MVLDLVVRFIVCSDVVLFIISQRDLSTHRTQELHCES